MKGIKPAFYAIIAVALIISVCGCTGQTNTTIQATNAPSEIPTAPVASGSHGAATSTPPSATPTTAPRSTATPTPSAPLTVGTSFPCIHETRDRTSVGVVTKVIDGDTIHVLINGTDYKVRYIGMNAPEDTTKKEWLGPEATARDKVLVAGKTVTLVKAADDLAAFMEAYLALQNGISNSQLQAAVQEKKLFYREKTIAGINLGEVYREFY
jgi:hypothetical protein